MSGRAPDRIELKSDDKIELTAVQAEQQATTAAPDSANIVRETSIGNPQLMEVEVKLGLASAKDHSAVKSLFSDYYLQTYRQENYFFDGSNQELSTKYHVMRLRFYNEDYKAVLTLKGRAKLEDGIGRATEVEEELNVKLARECLDKPSLILQQDRSNLVKQIRSDFEVKDLESLGGFRNIRDEYSWEGYKLEVDKTTYDFGTNFEIECETDHPEELRNKLEQILKENGINYHYKSSTKFQCFVKGNLLGE